MVACLQRAPAGIARPLPNCRASCDTPTTAAVQVEPQGWASGQVASQVSTRQTRGVPCPFPPQSLAAGGATCCSWGSHTVPSSPAQSQAAAVPPWCAQLLPLRGLQGGRGPRGRAIQDAGLQTQHDQMLPQAATLHQSSHGYQASRTWPGGTSSGEWRRQGSAAAPDALKPA